MYTGFFLSPYQIVFSPTLWTYPSKSRKQKSRHKFQKVPFHSASIYITYYTLSFQNRFNQYRLKISLSNSASEELEKAIYEVSNILPNR